MGGAELLKYYETHMPLTYENIMLVVNKLIDLLNFAVIPMNKKNLYHFDIKSANVLFDITTEKIRLIDWGLAHIITDRTSPDGIPSKIPFLFNTPYSSVFLRPDFRLSWSKTLNTNWKKRYSDGIEGVCKRYLAFYLKELKKKKFSHEDYINDVYETVKEKYEKANSKAPSDIVYDFLLKTLIKFTNETNEKTFEFNWEDFLTMYYHNVDIWGTLTCLIPLVEAVSFDMTKDEQDKIQEKVAEILMKYCYLNPTKPINIEDLTKDLDELVEEVDALGFWDGGKRTRKRRHKRKMTKRKMTKRKKMKKRRSRKHRSR
jgi:serine/threonine protein kinase